MKETDPRYFTLVYGVLDLTTQEFRYTSAGHCAPVYLPPGGKAYEVAEYGFPIGMFEEAQYEEQLIEMKPRGRLYLYSDGLTDAVNLRGEAFGKDRLIQAIEEGQGRSLKESLSRILGRVNEWSHATKLEDDVSVLAVEVGE